jgi:hypothetical protein
MRTRRNPDMPDERGYPFVIAQPFSTSDVKKIVNFYRTYCFHIELFIGSARHSTTCMVDGAFVIDLQYMNEVSVDVIGKLVSVGGGASVGDVDRALQPFNLAIPMGIHPEAGIAGITLGGGYGLLTRRYGMTVDYLQEIHIILPNGDEVIATRTNEYRDLLWACCGGGGNFGVVTKFVFQAIDILPKTLAGNVVYYSPTISSAVAVMVHADRLYQEMTLNDVSVLSIQTRSITVTTTWIHYGQELLIKDVRILEDARHLGGWYRLEDSIRERDYHHDIQSLLDHQFSSIRSDSHVYRAVIPIGSYDKYLPESFFEEMVKFIRKPLHSFLTAGKAMLISMGAQAITFDEHNDITCLPRSARLARYFVIVECWWRAEYGRHGKIEAKDWTRGIFDICSPFKSGVVLRGPLVDELGESLAEQAEKEEFKENDGMLDCHGNSNAIYQKLQLLKQKYDPRNMFINNINIQPYEKIDFLQSHTSTIKF